MRKFMFSTILCALCLILPIMFVGCGETRSFEEVSKMYHEAIGEYRGVFFNSSNEVSVAYAQRLQDEINSADSSSLFYNLKSDENNPAAIFEPALGANVLVMEYFIDWNLANYKNVPGEEMNSLYSSAENLKAKLYELKRVKIALEAASNMNNWIVDYRKAFCDAIVSFNNFSSKFLTIFEKYVNEDSAPNGRVSVAQTQLEFAKKVIDSATLVTDYYIKDSINKPFSGDSVISTNFVATYKAAKNVFASEKFQSVINQEKTQEEQKIIEILQKVEGYNSYYYFEKQKVENILSKNSFSALKEKETKNTLSADERIILDKLYDFFHTHTVMKNYMTEYKDALVAFSNA